MADLSLRALVQRMLGNTSTEDGGSEIEMYRRLRLAFNSPGVSTLGVLNFASLPIGAGVYDVQSYGAVGDGTTDDAAAITACALAAGVGGVVFFHPGKTYKISSGISMLLDDQTWVMSGAILGLNFVGAGITIGAAATRVRRARLVGGIVQPLSGALDWTAGGVGIRLLKCNNCVLDDVSVRWLEKGIEITSPAPPNASETTQNWIAPQMLADCALPIYLYANDTGAVNETTFYRGEVSYSGSCPSASARYAVTIDKHASASGNVNGTKFYGTYFGCSMVSNRPTAIYLNGVAALFSAAHIEGFPSPMVTMGADALAGGLPNIWFGGGANFLTPEIDLASGTTNNAGAFYYTGQDGAGIAGGFNAGSAYVWLVKVLGAATKTALAIKNSSNTTTATITGEGIISGTWVKNGGSQAVAVQIDATSTTFANVTATSLVSGRTYEFEALLFVTASGVGGSKVRVNASGGLTVSAIRYDVTLTDMGGTAIANTRATALDTVASNAGSVTAAQWVIRGTATASADGSLNIQFAQNSASGTSSVLVGSRVDVRQLG